MLLGQELISIRVQARVRIRLRSLFDWKIQYKKHDRNNIQYAYIPFNVNQVHLSKIFIHESKQHTPQTKLLAPAAVAVATAKHPE